MASVKTGQTVPRGSLKVKNVSLQMLCSLSSSCIRATRGPVSTRIIGAYGYAQQAFGETSHRYARKDRVARLSHSRSGARPSHKDAFSRHLALPVSRVRRSRLE